MPQVNYTPIQLYRSGTPGATPSAGLMQNGELAINYADGKLFYKDGAGTARTVVTPDGSVTTAKIADANVTTAKIADANVTTAKLSTGAVTAAKMATGAAVVNIGAGGITNNELASNAVTTAKIADANVTPAKLSQPLTRGTSVNSNSGTAIDFTGIPSWVKRITLMLENVQVASGVYLRLQLGTSGGIVSSGYTSVVGDSGGVHTATAGFDLVQASGAAYYWSGAITLLLIDGNNWVESGLLGTTNPGATISYSAGRVSLATSVLTTVRLTTSTGGTAFTNGYVNIMYD